MKLLEYQGKELFRRAGIAVPPGTHVTTADAAADFVRQNPGSWVLKSQVLVGGRGKAGGIKFVETADDARTTSDALLQLVIRNEQNPDGERVTSVLVERKLSIASEAYVSIAIDRAAKRPVVIVSAEGGMDVEEVAKHRPHAIAKAWIDTNVGFSPFVARQLAFRANLPAGFHKSFASIVSALYGVFMTYGATLVEINPLVLTVDGDVFASDAKVELDDSGLARHPELASWNTETAADEDQRAALAIGLGSSNYARLGGSIGVIANGAGLGMGTMDAIKIAGGEAANFLDIGGGAKAELVKKSIDLVVSDPRVKAMFINIFGGITRGDQVARGIVEALAGDDMRKVPLVVRLTGTNEKEGRAILAAAGMNPVETMDEGAQRAVAFAAA